MPRGGFRLGKLFGITVRLDWSWLFIFALITWNLATAFAQFHRDWSPTLRWGMALAASLLFFSSVLAHEMAHSLVARAQGVPVKNITLFLFGGVSNIQQEPRSPRNEFLMAFLGPLTSLVLGGLLLLIAGAIAGPLQAGTGSPISAIGRLSPLSTILLWLGSINVILGVFNLVPGFPLDGGRVLRSILWAITRNLRRATRWATWVGQGIAWLMIVAGIAMVFGAELPILGGGLINGLWLSFIGWFLSNAASQSYQRVVIQDVLEGVPVRQLMRTDPPSVPANVRVSDLVHDYIMRSDDYAFPVIEGGRFVGLVTMHDVRAVPRGEWDDRLVREIMTPAERLVTTTEDEDTSEALDKLLQRDVRQLPVLHDGQLVGLLRRNDIVRYLRLQSDLGDSDSRLRGSAE